ELLMHILERNSQEQLRSFFQAYGAVESAAMCYLIATSAPPGTLTSSSSLGPAGSSSATLGGPLGPSSGSASYGGLAGGSSYWPSVASCSLGGGGVSAVAARAAAAALENPLLVGEARMPE
ncbi:hypothetical protein Agub_g15095, partial [Astrephomene gubernaculifera]